MIPSSSISEANAYVPLFRRVGYSPTLPVYVQPAGEGDPWDRHVLYCAGRRSAGLVP
jgi:hypothetical protein